MNNHPPVWTPDSIQITGQPGSLISIQLNDKCSDPEMDSILFTLSAAPPADDTVKGSVYSFTPLEKDTGTHTVRITATDVKGASSTLIMQLTITKTDLKKPVITLLSPSSDTVLAVDSLVITAICKDESGIRSLMAYLDTISFAIVKPPVADSLWTGTVKPLSAGKFTTVKLVATDSSKALNKDSVVIHVKYDSDTVKPVITKVASASDCASTNSSSYTITVNCKDQSGIASMKGTSGNKAFTGPRGSGDSLRMHIQKRNRINCTFTGD